MIFKDERHESLFWSILDEMDNDDVYHTALAYLIALDNVCRKHVNEIYNFEEHLIRPACLCRGWQTGTSIKTTLLAFNLYTDHTAFCKNNEVSYCSVANIFCCSYAPYYWQALKIRYPEFTEDDE